MALVIPPWYFAHNTCWIGQNESSLAQLIPGAAPTSGAAHTKGSTVTLLTALTHDVHCIAIAIMNTGGSLVEGAALADIMIDPAGGTSWAATPLISNIIGGTQTSHGAAGTPYAQWLMFPIFVASGSSLGVRLQHSSATITPRVNCHVWGNPSNPAMWWFGNGVETLGADTSTSRGTPVTPDASGTYGSWTDIGTSTSNYGAVTFGVNSFGDNAVDAKGYYFQLGTNSTQLPGSPTMYSSTTTIETSAKVKPPMMIGCNIPSGTTLQVRATCSTTVTDIPNFCVYGVY